MPTRRQFVLLAGSALCVGAAPADDPNQLFIEELRYTPLWRFHAERIAADPGKRLSSTQFFAMLGDERGAMTPGQGDAPPDLSAFKAHDALDTIVAAAADRRVVIVNEAHNVSGHRAFVHDLIVRLREVGFGTYAAETFTTGPTPRPVAEWRPGEAVTPMLGWYLCDPVFAELIRGAAGMGYALRPYEARDDQYLLPETAPSADRVAEREEAEAVNFIAEVLNADRDARVVVHCGYFHAAEAPMGNPAVPWFAARLKAKTGIDPLTIDQSQSWPGPPGGARSPMAQAILDRFRPSRAIIVRDGAGALFGPSPLGKAVDLSVFHPEWPDIDGRPGWLLAQGRRAVPFKLAAPAGPYNLLQALPAAEPAKTVASDQLPLKEGQISATLMLRPGRYRVRIETLQGYSDLGALNVD